VNNVGVPVETIRSRVRRERRIAEQARTAWGLDHVPLTLLKHSITTLFRLDAHERLVLRLLPPDRHPRVVVKSELDWLLALGQEAGLIVPEPVPARDGSLLVDIHDPESGAVRYAYVCRWAHGQHKRSRLTGADAERLGAVLARLHAFAEQYVPPSDFVRWDFDDETFRDNLHVLERKRGELAPENQQLLEGASKRVLDAMAAVGRGADAYGMIHADTNLSNIRFDGVRVGLIDFEVSCLGYYLFDIGRLRHELRALGARGADLFAALHRGYNQVRQLPAPGDEWITAFEFMSLVDIVVWVLDMPSVLRLPGHDLQLAATLETIRRLDEQ
jgi:Ser/Thr protein kinase RdoA (MazF antagonist)